MKRNVFFSLLIIAFAALVFNGCKKEEGTSTVMVQLTDTPATYDAVHVEVTGVEVHTNIQGWMTVPVNDSIYDLLQLDSANALLGSLAVTSGTLSEIRLILGSQNTVTINSVVYPLSLSSQDESGLKLSVHQELSNNTTYTLVLDFNAAQSVIDNGNGTYKLKPVISASFH
jgi:Domain of unknown function (DUF4382)